MTWFVQLYDNKPFGNPISKENLSYIIPNIDFDKVITPRVMAGTGYGIYEFTNKPTTKEKYKKIVETVPVLHDNGIYYQTWTILEMNSLERSIIDRVEIEKIQGMIREYLKMTDWTQLSDVNLSDKKKLSYKIFRQNLRDLNKIIDFPNNALKRPTFTEFVNLQSVSLCDSPGFVNHSKNYNSENFKFQDITIDYLRSVYDDIMINQPDSSLVPNVKFWFDIEKDL